MGCSHTSTINFKWQDRKENKGIFISKQSQLKLVNSNLVLLNNNSISKSYKLIKKIGSGTFGMVYKVKHKETKSLRAMKVIKKDTINYQDDNKEFLKEIEILSILDHPNILKIYEYFVDEINYYILTELSNGGELYDEITKIKNYNEKKASLIIDQLLSAVKYLHSKNIVHRDLKPENILLENKNADQPIIKLIDFGSSNYCTDSQRLTLKVGAPYYIAPEVIKGSYNNKCDIWSVGVILFILLSGVPPFDGENDVEIMNKVKIGKYSIESKEWCVISNEAKDLITKLLEYNPKKRISADEARKHIWITRNKDNQQIENNENSIVNNINLTNEKLDFKKPFENLKKFNAKQKLQQTTIAFLVRQIGNTDIIKELRKIFQKLDKDGDGSLSFDELKKGFITFYGDIAEKEWEEIVNKLDQDGSNSIEYEEFIRCTINLEDILTENNLKMAFSRYDTDGSGYLDIKEIKSALGVVEKDNISSELINEIINEIDNNGDGEISFEEFKELMMKVLKEE